MKMTYRQVRKGYNALQELAAVRDRGMVKSSDGNMAYEGKPVLPRVAKMKVRGMMRELAPYAEDLNQEEQDIAGEANLETQQGVVEMNQETRRLLNRYVGGDDDPIDIPIQVLRATDLGDKALKHIPENALVQLFMAGLFDDDEDLEDGAGDPRNRSERRED